MGGGRTARAAAPAGTRAARESRTPARARSGAQACALALVALALYANTLGHLYALDDGIVITNNVYTKQGLRGIPELFRHDTFFGCFQAQKNLVSGGRYRPLSLATFALEVQLAGQNPHLSHAVNAALYALTGVLLFVLLRRLFRDRERIDGWTGAPFLVTLLFLAHPLHTEVVANIKGRDEILALLLVLVSFLACLRFRDGGRARWAALALASVSFFLAALAKESALPFTIVIPLALWFFRAPDRRRIAVVSAALLVPSAAYLAMRAIFAAPSAPPVPEILNDPFLGATLSQRLGTVCKTFGLYLRLFLVPWPLTHDYYFDQVPRAALATPQALIPLAIAILLGAVALRGLRSRSPVAFGLLFFAGSFSIVSNLVVTVGTTMAERFLYIPSLGLALALVFALRGGLERAAGARGARAAAVALLCLSGVFSVLTIARNPAWKDNLTLFTTDVRTSVRSAKLQTAAASVLTDSAATRPDSIARVAMLRDALAHAEEAVRIYPRHALAWVLLGNIHMQLGRDPARALACFRRAADYQPTMKEAYQDAAVAENRLGEYAQALADVRRLQALGEHGADAAVLASEAYEGMGAPDSAIAALENAPADLADEARVVGRLGRLLGRYRGDYARAIAYLTRAAALDPGDESHLANLGVAQAMAGRPQDAVATFHAALARFGGSAELYRNLGLAWQSLGRADSARACFLRAGLLESGAVPGAPH